MRTSAARMTARTSTTAALTAMAALAAALLLPAPELQAQDFPAKPIRLIVPNPPGGTLDIAARILGPRMAELSGQPTLIENRPGADTNIGTELVARAAPDGYTVLVQTVPFVVNPSLFSKLPFDVNRDFAPVSLIASVPFALVVNNGVPAKSVKELVALARARPGKLNYASAGNGSNLHVAAELLNSLAGVNMVHIQYKGGGPALVAVLGGEVDLTYLNLAAVTQHVRAGKLRALGLTGTTRSALLPDVPTIAESGVPGYEFTSWVGTLVPAATPEKVVLRLNDIINRAARTPEAMKSFADQGAEMITSTPAQFAAHLKSELARWAKVIKERGIKAE
jgi:tripartite-type tricarboxylate transporter receptor subunit TctC